jgi:hypothetical protein
MADAAKSDEIEDVLSSIRRLVSEHQPPARSEPARAEASEPRPDGVVQPPEDAPAAGDRLLLTPALRVTDPEDPWVPIVPRAGEAQQSESADSAPVENADIARDDGADWARELWADDSAGDVEVPEVQAEHMPDPQLQADQWEAGDLAAAEGTPLDDGLTDPVDVTEALLQDVAEAAAEVDDEEFADVPLSFIRSTSSVSDYEPGEDNDALPDGDLPAPTLELAEARAGGSG